MSSTSVSKPRSPRPVHTQSAPNPADNPKSPLRKEKIERARKLIADPNYPSPKVIQSVSRILARKWEAESKKRSK